MKMKSLVGAALLLASGQTFAGAITNGDFSNSCSLSGWQEYGETTIGGTVGSCHADLAVNDNDFEAELSQVVSFDAATDYILSVDFDFTSTLGSTLDQFYISLINMNWEFYDLLAPADISLGNNTLDIMISGAFLASNFSNQDWNFSLYLSDYEYGDQSSTLVSINSVSLDAKVNEVPEPASWAILSLGLLGLCSRRQLMKGADRI